MTEESNNIDPRSGGRAELDEHSVDPDPFLQFETWFNDAVSSDVPEPEAMFLASADKNGFPSGRVVLLKGFDSRGFVFYTNYKSRKGSEIGANPNVAIVFHWKETKRQVRITGKAHKVSKAESDEYFSSRPPESRFSAIISPQSSVIPGRIFLDEKFQEMQRSATAIDTARPAHWGGYRIIPDTFEFWQLRLHRLHDRIRYRLVRNQWLIERLAP
jgi:pyridoxamine 5'-phosphate oxidase